MSGAARQTLVVAIVVIAATAIAGGLWLQARTPAPPSSRAAASQSRLMDLLPQDLAVATVRDIVREIPLTGAVSALNTTEVKSKLAGEVKAVPVREGDSVRRGQVLARLDTVDLASKLRDREASLDAGKAQLALADKNRTMNLTLLKQNFISQSAFDNTQSQHQVSQATVRSLEAQVDQARKALADAVVRSPIDGVIAERVAQPGSMVTANGKLLTVVDLRTMVLEAPVPASDIPAVRVGQQATFRIEGFADREFTGVVERINPGVQAGSRSIPVHLIIPNPGHELKGGMFAQGSLVVEGHKAVTSIPVSAVRDDAGTAYVFAIRNQKIARQPIELGLRDSRDGVVEVTRGLEPGTRVVAGGMANLVDGMPVRILEPQARSRP